MTVQVDAQGNLCHLLDIENLNATMITRILDQAQQFFVPNSRSFRETQQLRHKTVVNLFYEPSTRTRATFELAAKRLGANVLNFEVNNSSSNKGESLEDTVRNLQAMQCELLVIRHAASGAAHFLAQQMRQHMHIINAGDGCHAHPTQALLDLYTIRQHRGDFRQLKVAIVGDVLHSRVARSQIHALNLMQTGEVRVIAPKTLLPPQASSLGVQVFHDLSRGLAQVDVIIMLRLQQERMQKGLLPPVGAYYRAFGLTPRSIAAAAPNALIIHPGPINRGVEIDSELADGPNAVILDQVTNGVAIRMAVLAILANANNGIAQR